MNQKVSSKQQFWSAHIQAHRQSELSQNEYCRRNNLQAGQFRYWNKKLEEQSGESAALEGKVKSNQQPFVAVSVEEAPPPSHGLSLHLPGGCQLTGITESNVSLVRLIIGSS